MLIELITESEFQKKEILKLESWLSYYKNESKDHRKVSLELELPEWWDVPHKKLCSGNCNDYNVK